jgi:hypothetical protein
VAACPGFETALFPWKRNWECLGEANGGLYANARGKQMKKALKEFIV